MNSIVIQQPPPQPPTPPPPISLKIKVPAYISEEVLIAQLRWLETKECRRVLSEPERIAERRVVTEKFKTVLTFKESWLGAP